MVIVHRKHGLISQAIALLVVTSFHMGASHAQAVVTSMTTTPTQTRDLEANRRRTMARRRRVQEGNDQRQEAATIAVNGLPGASDVAVRPHHRPLSVHNDSTAAGRPAAPRAAGVPDAVNP